MLRRWRVRRGSARSGAVAGPLSCASGERSGLAARSPRHGAPAGPAAGGSAPWAHPRESSRSSRAIGSSNFADRRSSASSGWSEISVGPAGSNVAASGARDFLVVPSLPTERGHRSDRAVLRPRRPTQAGAFVARPARPAGAASPSSPHFRSSSVKIPRRPAFDRADRIPRAGDRTALRPGHPGRSCRRPQHRRVELRRPGPPVRASSAPRRARDGKGVGTRSARVPARIAGTSPVAGSVQCGSGGTVCSAGPGRRCPGPIVFVVPAGGAAGRLGTTIRTRPAAIAGVFPAPRLVSSSRASAPSDL